MNITAEQEKEIIIEILQRMNVSMEHAEIVADVTLDANLKGFYITWTGKIPSICKGT